MWAEEGARILEQGEIVSGHLASAGLIAARVTGADPKVLAAVIRGVVANTLRTEGLQRLNGKADAANQKIVGLLKAIPTASVAECEGDHSSTPYEPTFRQAVVKFLERQWRQRRAV